MGPYILKGEIHPKAVCLLEQLKQMRHSAQICAEALNAKQSWSDVAIQYLRKKK